MLKQLLLNKRISTLKAKLDATRAMEATFATRRTALETREAELEAAVTELTDTATDEEKAVVEEAVTAFEAEKAAVDAEEAANNAEKKRLEDEIKDLEKELDGIGEPDESAKTAEPDVRKEGKTAMIRNSTFFKTREDRTSFVARAEVKAFLARTREFIGQKRSVSGSEFTIPEVMLELLRDNLSRYSKLVQYIFVRPVKGKARQNIMGAIPEAVWTEACGKLNELLISFAQVEVDGYKVGGFVPVCNATLEDSDENLAEEIMDALGQGIGYAIDKAILYGTGSKMPLGIATRLAQTSEPSDWNDNAPAWTDLHSSHVLTINPAGMTAEAFFAALVADLGVASIDYSNGKTFWAMNRKTKMALLAKMITFNAAGALVAGMNNTMPVEGGDIVELPFIADNDIIGGFGSLYLLAERSGAQLAQSEHVLFIEDQTVFKGTARYDGMPVFGEAFVTVNIANGSPTMTATFPQDVANTVATPTALPIAGNFTTSTNVALSCATAGASIYYTTDGSTPDSTDTLYNGPIALSATTTIKAIAYKSGMTTSAVLSSTHTKSA